MTVVAMGTTLKKGTELIANLTSIDGISVSADTIETTTLDSVGGFRQFTTSLKDAGEVSISGHFDHTAHAGLFDDFNDNITSTYTIEFPDKGATGTGTTWTFSGVVTAYGTSAELEDLVSFEATIKVSGAPTLAPPV